jgi:predicted dehydrogenase
MEFEQGELWWTSRGDKHDQREAPGDDVWIYSHDRKRKRVELPRLKYIDRAGALAVFVESLATGTAPECSGADNLESLAIVYAAVESAARCQPVELAKVG